MARSSRDTTFAFEEDLPSGRRIWRLAMWGGISLVCVSLALLSTFSGGGSRPDSTTAAPAPRRPDAEIETRRLSEAVRTLTADRDRLVARVSALERSLDDVTGALPKGDGRAAPPATPAPAPAPEMAAPVPAPAPEPPRTIPLGRSQPQASSVPLPGSLLPLVQPSSRVAAGFSTTADFAASGSVATRTDFGIDLGSAASVDGLRTLWSTVRSGHVSLLDGLTPVIAIREGPKPGAMELRLIAGPIANAGLAARLCASLAAASVSCEPAVYDGQRLALK
jgi:hypothetical protein